MAEAYTEDVVSGFTMLDECEKLSGFGWNSRSGASQDLVVVAERGKVDLVVINDVELAVFVFPEDLDEVIDERVMIINDKYIFYF